MTKTITKVVYKPDSQSTEEYILIVDHDEYVKFKNGDTSIAVALIVDSFDIFVSQQGHQGLLGKASDQQLATVFATSDKQKAKDVQDVAIRKILDDGEAKLGEALPKGYSGTNDSRGGTNHTTTTR